jgi:hypothetical protein
MAEKKDRTEYQHEYYRQNKERFARKKRERYANDPEYRRMIREASERYRDKKKEETIRLIAEGKLKPRGKTGPRKPTIVMIGGIDVPAYTITTFANRVGRSINTVNKWISIGTIPRTPLRAACGDRLYTEAMMLIVKDVLDGLKIVGKDKDICSDIEARWAEIGVFAEKQAR